MQLPVSNARPPFDVTRSSHVVLTVQDVAASRTFYEEVIGLIATEAMGNTLYLSGIEEACHRSLVLRESREVGGSLGFGRAVERGLGRHGPGHAMFVYFRDPYGHRVELFNTHYQVTDIENEPILWEPKDPNVSFPWGLPAQSRWLEQATKFKGIAIEEAHPKPSPLKLERSLAAQEMNCEADVRAQTCGAGK